MKHDLLIGRQVTVVSSNNKTLAGLSGRIVDETLNAIVIEKDDGRLVTVIKKTSTFNIEGIEVVGTEVQQRPHERLKQKWKRK